VSSGSQENEFTAESAKNAEMTKILDRITEPVIGIQRPRLAFSAYSAPSAVNGFQIFMGEVI
jgi:hypothetical protein